MTIVITSQKSLDAEIIKADGSYLEVRIDKAGEYEITSSNPISVIISSNEEILICARGSSQPRVVARESSQPRVVARESSQPRVEAWGSSQPRVEAWESSQPRVEARGSSQPRVVARESSQPRVVASGYVQLSIFGKVVATLTAKCQALIQGAGAEVTGGKQTTIKLKTPKDWCDYYGVPVKNGVATLYKGVNNDFTSHYNPSFKYTPGTKPKAPDWDGGQAECGKGLHFSPHPTMTKEFISEPKHFVACPVRVKDMVIHPDGSYPQKCKASHVHAPCWEVDEDGNKL
jgi:hypothetical protein